MLMWYLSSVIIWIPVYLLLAWLLYKSIGKKTIAAVICAGILIVCCDQSANLVKKSVKRYRPSHNTEMEKQVHVVDNYRGGQYGFVSGHAANTFGLVFFLLFLFKEKKKWFKLLLVFWACLVSYSRIYLGVHYPSDIIGGAILGGLLAWLFSLAYFKFSVKIIR